MQQQYEEQNKPLPEALHNYFFINKYAASHYQVKPYTGNMLLIQPEVRDPAFEYEPYLGWERFITGTIIERFVPGTHRSILDEPYVEELAATVQEGVEKVAAKSS
jgi:thioesterase domain-containing protein